MRQPFTGIYLWRDPHGVVYLEDHTGTHEITGSGGGVPRGEVEVEVYPTGTVVEADFGQGA